MSPTSSTKKPTPIDQLDIPIDRSTIMKDDIVKLLTAEQNKKGRNVSGRSWKIRPQKRSSLKIKSRTFTNKETKQLELELKEQTKQSKIQKRLRREENEKRRAMNEYEQTKVMVLNSNTAHTKLRAMSKKQLRQIKKSRVNTKTGVVEYVPLYQK
eukprot:CAMPEP_0119568020 /NCGR_PEP_ID=MMETSP1352-20130426/37682_1 /TAXON_ID=265584 /ORGANISM="Stauroneis constricta, Strain CCMP1120" /LENGTH=154 /DNA_ID=CAMNT_0007617353 /DNA_START=81 /DNA_END=548 /DNA_ORIENTATION=-